MASINDIAFLPKIEYTSRDYISIKSALVKHVQTHFPNDFTDFTESGLGAIFLEFVAYVGDQLSFYLDRQVNEMFLPTASQRQSVLNLVNLIGYVPRSTSAAIAPIRATLNIAQSDPVVIQAFTNFIDKDNNQWEFLETVTIPIGRVDTFGIQITDEVLGQGDGSSTSYSFLADNENINITGVIIKFTISSVQHQLTVKTDGVIPVPFGGTGILEFDTGEVSLSFTSGNVPDNATNILLSYTYNQKIQAFQGVTKLDVFSSDGSLDQEFVLSNNPVLVSPRKEEVEASPNPNKFEVWIGDPGSPFGNGTGTKLERVDDLATAGPVDDVYAIRFDDFDRLIIEFGDGTNGSIPPSGINNISIIYRVGGGNKGNVSAGFIDSSVTGKAGLLAVTVGITNFEAATGGRERESLNEIRVNAPAFLKTNDTATTEQDYDSLSIFSKSGFGAVSRAKSRLTPPIQVTTKTIHSAEVLGTIPVGAPLEYFLFLPATPLDVDSIIVQYTVGGVTRTVTASSLGGGLASIIGDATVDASSRIRIDEQNFDDEIFDFGTGSLFNFSGNLLGFPVLPGSVTLQYTIGGQVRVGFDDSNGSILGSGIFSGSIDYSDGSIVLEFGTNASVTTANPEVYDLDSLNAGGSVDINISVNGGLAQNIVFDSSDPLIAVFSAVTADEVADVINDQVSGAVSTSSSGLVTISSNAFGPSSTIQVTSGTDDANVEFGFPVTLQSGTGTAPDNATAITFDYQSCLFLLLNTAPTVGTDILFSGESGPTIKEFPTNNVEIYTWAENASGELIPPTSALKDNLKNFLDIRRVLGTSIEILSGFNVIIHYNLDVVFNPAVDQNTTVQNIVAAFEEYFDSVVDVVPGQNVTLAAVYDAVFPTQGIEEVTVIDVGVRVPVAVGDGVKSVFKSDSDTPGKHISSDKLPSQTGIGKVKVFRQDVQVGLGDASSPTVNITGSEVLSGSTFNKDTGIFDLRISPPPPKGDIVYLDYLLDDSDLTIWNVDIKEWEIAVLGTITINGTVVRS